MNPAAPPSAGSAQLPPGCPPLGLDGFCAVTLIEQRAWKQGDPRYGAIHRNRTYIFCGPAEQQRFLQNPDAYSPMMSGDDPVLALDQSRAVPGSRKHGVFFGNRVYLFSSEQTLADFQRNPNRYAPEISQARRPDAR
jgi:YHS domain-containing protein